MVTDNEISGGENGGQVLRFGLYYEGKMVQVSVAAGESDFGVHFDGQLIDVIEQHESDQWEGQTGYLDDEVLQVIGKRIDEWFG